MQNSFGEPRYKQKRTWFQIGQFWLIKHEDQQLATKTPMGYIPGTSWTHRVGKWNKTLEMLSEVVFTPT